MDGHFPRSSMQFRKKARMTTVVEQTKESGDREQARRSRPVLMQQIAQGTSLSHAAKYWWAKATKVARLRGFSRD